MSSGSLIDEVARQQFERAWREGEPCPIERVLPPSDDPRHLATLEELVLIELELRWKASPAGPPVPGLDDYLARFPELAETEILERLRSEEEHLCKRFSPLPTLVGTGGVLDPILCPPGYEILDKLGRGGMGVVWRAKQLCPERIVALKMIRPDAGVEELQRLRAEADAIARLQHPGIVQIFEVGEHAGQPFFSLEYCAGGSLDRQLGGTPLPPTAAALLVKQLAQAMQAAHDAGIIHRDLKPSNVLLVSPGCQSGETLVPKIADFGLARRLDVPGHTLTGAVLGTPSYMAPEQARGEKTLGPACDIYALGGILYECLTGRPPFRSANAYDTLLQVLDEDPVPPSRFVRLPRDLETICLKCLRKEPLARYASARDLAEDLERYQRGEPIHARATGSLERAWKWARRRPAAAGLLVVSGGLLLALVAFVVGLAYYSRLQAALLTAEHERERAAEQEGLARNYLHLARMSLAMRASEEGQIPEMVQLLDTEPASLRGFEWHFLQRLSRCLHTVRSAGGDFEDVTWSRDGNYLAAAELEGPIHLLATKGYSELLTLPGHGKYTGRVVFSPDGKRLASAGGDGTLRVHEVATGQRVFEVPISPEPVSGLAFSPDGMQLAMTELNGSLEVRDAGSGDRRFAVNTATTPGRLAYSPDGGVLAFAYSAPGKAGGPKVTGGVRVVDATTGAAVFDLEGHAWTLAFSPDGSRLVSGGLEGQLQVRDTKTGKLLSTTDTHKNGISAIAFSRDGRTLASTGWDLAIRLWDTTTWKEILAFRGHAERPRRESAGRRWNTTHALAFGPGGGTLVSAGCDRTLRLWDIAPRPRPVVLQATPGKVVQAILGARETRLATVTDDAVRLWDTSTGNLVGTFPGKSRPIRRVLFSPQGGHLLEASGKSTLTFAVRDLASGKAVLEFASPIASVDAASFSENGRWLAVAQDRLRVWDLTTASRVHEFPPHAKYILSLAFSPDGTRLAIGSEDSTVTVRDVLSGKVVFLLTGHTWGVRHVSFRPDGQVLATASGDNTIKLWNMTTGKELRTLPGHAGGTRWARFNSDGTRLASMGENGQTKIWDPAMGLETLLLRSANPWGRLEILDPSGNRLAVTGSIWDVTVP